MTLLERLIRWAAPEVPYLKGHPATVQRTLDTAIELMPDDATLFGGAAIEVPKPPQVEYAAQGARCLLMFEHADPSRPYIAAWDDALRGNRVSFRSGARRIARETDPIEAALPSLTLPVAGTTGGTQTIPGSPPVVVPIPPGTPFNGVLTLAFAPIGIVEGGAEKLFA